MKPRGVGIAVFAMLLSWYVARYGDCASFFFHFDDFWTFGDASRVAGMFDVFRPGAAHFVLYRPLSTVGYFWVLHSLFGYDAGAYHATQLLAHVVNAFLVYGVASLTLRSRLLGLGAAAIYAAEPGHVIAIYWNAPYTMTGTVFWYLSCLWLWIAGLERVANSRSGAIEKLRFAGCFVLFLGALLSSEHGVTLPLTLAVASLLLGYDPWKRALWRLAPFFVVAFIYAAAKVAYLRYGFDADFPDPLVNLVYRTQYQPTIDPIASLRMLGFYVGCASGWLYDPSAEAAKWQGLSAGLLALIALSAWWARRSDFGRRVCFGLLLFLIPLAPVLLLPAHAHSYYIGTAGAGFAIALMAAASAVPRLGNTTAVMLAALLLVGEILVGEPRVRASDDLRFFRDFQQGALAWLDGVDNLARNHPGVREVIVPANVVTELVFHQGDAHHLLLGATYDVRLSKDLTVEPLAAGQEICSQPGSWRRGTDYPGRRPQWDWLGRRIPCEGRNN